MKSVEKLIPIIISIFAIVISGVTFYYQFFHIPHNFKTSIVDGYASSDKLSIKMVFINHGSRYEGITEILFLVPFDLNFSGFEIFDTIKEPLIVKPGELALIKIETTDFNWEKLKIAKSNLRKNFDCPVWIKFNIIDKNGNKSEVIYKNFFIIFTGDGVNGCYFNKQIVDLI